MAPETSVPKDHKGRGARRQRPETRATKAEARGHGEPEATGPESNRIEARGQSSETTGSQRPQTKPEGSKPEA